MGKPAVVLLVRFRSSLTPEQATKVVEERAPQFRALPGLKQKYYLQDTNTGEYAGLYLWESSDSLDAFRRSELRASIAQSYQVVGEPRIEEYGIFKTLREEDP